MPGASRSVGNISGFFNRMDSEAGATSLNNRNTVDNKNLTVSATSAMDKYHRLAERVSKLFRKEMAEGQKSLNDKLREQGNIITTVNKRWKEMTGAIIGSFYTIAKLSPLFASYISEFGGILGYVYDTVLAPFSDEIEWLLDKLWEFGDWFENSPESTKKFTGALLLAIPILTGFAIAAAIGIGTLEKFGKLTVVQKIVGIAGAISTTTLVFGILLVAATALFVYFETKTGAISKNFDDMKNSISNTFANISSIIESYKVIIYDNLVNMIGKEATDKLIGYYVSAKDIIVGCFDSILSKMGEVYTYITNNFSPIGRAKQNWSIIEDVTSWAAEKARGHAAQHSGYATGATITQDGLYRLHQGETVTPSSIANSKSEATTIVNINPNITIQGGVGAYQSMSETKKLADSLSKYWMADIRSVMGGSHR